MMNDYENLEKMLDESPMGEYAMYVREDLIEFALLAIQETKALWYAKGHADGAKVNQDYQTLRTFDGKLS